METTSQLDELIAALTKLREASPLKGQTVPCICFQGMEYVPVSSAKLDIDPDGATLLLIPEEPNAVQTALDRLADQVEKPVTTIEWGALSQPAERYTDAALSTLPRKHIEAIGSSLVAGPDGPEPCTILFFTDGTRHAFVHPADSE